MSRGTLELLGPIGGKDSSSGHAVEVARAARSFVRVGPCSSGQADALFAATAPACVTELFTEADASAGRCLLFVSGADDLLFW
jgi:hypothetical protein